MKLIDTLKAKAKAIKKEITALYYAYTDRNLKAFPKAMIAITLAYALSPIDLIPDFIPVIGYLDDLIIVPALIFLCIKLIPPAIMSESRIRAEAEPLRLKKNWITGAVFVCVWLLLIGVVASSIVRACGA